MAELKLRHFEKKSRALVGGVGAIEGSGEGSESEHHLVAVRGDGNLCIRKHDPGGIFGLPCLPGLVFARIDIESGHCHFSRLDGPREDVTRVRAPTDNIFARLKTLYRSSGIVLDGEGVPGAVSHN